MAHPRAKLTVAGRRLLVERMLERGWPPARAAEAQGVSVATAYKWLGRWRAEGWPGWLTAALGLRPATGGCRWAASRRSCPSGSVIGLGRTGSAGRWARPPRRCMRSCAATRCQGCGSWTAPPGSWCAISGSGPGNWSTWTSRNRVASLTVVATGCMGEDAGGVGAASGGWAMTLCMPRWMTAPEWRIWRSIPMSAPPPWPASPNGRWPSSPVWAWGSSGS